MKQINQKEGMHLDKAEIMKQQIGKNNELNQNIIVLWIDF